MKRQRQDMPQLPQDLGMSAQGMYYDPSMMQGGGMGGFDPSMGGGMGGFDPTMSGMGMGMGMGANIEQFPCVKLRGLPFECNEDDVRLFLGLDPVDILLGKRDGRFTGEAYVVLGAPLMVEMALSKHKMYLGNRFVEVFIAKKLDYYKAVANEMMVGGFQPMRGGGGGRGFGGGGGGGYHDGGYGGGGGGGGNFSGGFDPTQSGHVSGGGFGGGLNSGGALSNAASGSGGTTWIKMRGLPFSVTVDEIAAWYEPEALGITPLDSSRVYIWTEGGRPTGMAIVEFPTPQEATNALAKNKQNLGSRYIELFPATRSDLQKFQERTGINLPNLQ